MHRSAGTMDLWKRAAPGLLGGLCVLASNTSIVGGHLDKPRILRESEWPGSDSTSGDEEAREPAWPGSEITSAEKGEQPQLRYEETASGLEELLLGPVPILQLSLTRDETDEPDDVSGQDAFEALESLEEYSADDWDMDGARPITLEVLRIAASVLQRMPENAAAPDVAPAADGTVCMEWLAPSGLLWVDVGPERIAWMLTKIDGKREEKRLPVDGRDFWVEFREALERLYPPRSEKGFRAFFVAV